MGTTDNNLYTTRLGAGLGLIEETKILLRLWEPGISVKQLHQLALRSGALPELTSRRLLNIVAEGFGPRYLVDDAKSAKFLKCVDSLLSGTEFKQILFLHTCRANLILADFVKEVYWPRYAQGAAELTNLDADSFIRRSLDDERMHKRWSESVVKRVASYLLGCLSDYGLLKGEHSSRRKFAPFQISSNVALYLAYDLHFSGVGDNSLLEHGDWKLFGLEDQEVLDVMKKLSLKGAFIVQAAAGLVKISWKYNSLAEVCHVIAKS